MRQVNKRLEVIVAICRMLVLIGIYGTTLFVVSNCRAESYPQITVTPLTADLSMNQYKLKGVGDIITKGPWVDVRAFGAVGNGETDDTTTIQNAIDSLVNGGVVFFPKGSWRITQTINLKRSITLLGIGKEKSIIMCQPGTGFTMLKIGDAITGGVSYGNIRDLRIQGPGKGVTNAVGILVVGTNTLSSAGWTFENITMENLQFGFIFQDRCDTNYLREVYIANASVGISLQSTANAITIDNPHIYLCDYGIQIGTVNVCGQVIVRGGNIESSSNGIFIGNNAKGVEIDGTYFEGNSPLDIVVDTNVLGASIKNCYIVSEEPNDQDYIRCEASGATISDNYFHHNPTFAAINLTGTSSNCVVKNNKFYLTTRKYNDSGTNNLITEGNQVLATQIYNKQIVSSLATGTPPFSITSTTPVSNLTTVPVTYGAAGNQQVNAHIVRDAVTLTSGIATVNLSGAAMFSNASSYSVNVGEVKAGTSTQNFTVEYVSGSQFKIRSSSSTSTDTVRFIAIGN